MKLQSAVIYCSLNLMFRFTGSKYSKSKYSTRAENTDDKCCKG
ncbi:hypothetical protein FDUTEX481_00295 [Tolypothrix sp. PCC 7601]|nr:hypothetical protein FDUTEX481_00295 [Tolypothrix sp. PCC 7601]